MPDPIVHITNGIPDSGTGNITTLGQTLTDGANVALGATTDAAVTAGAAGTVNAHLRSISRDIAGGVVLQPGTNVIGHVVVDSGSITANAGTNLNTSALALESGGNLASVKTNTDKILSSATNITAGAAVATTSFVIGTRYLSAPPTFTNGQEGALQIDANGKLLVAGSFSATPAVNTFTHISTSTITNGIKSGAGTLSRIVVNQTGTVASLITVYDNTTATGTVIAIIDGLSRTGNYDYECAFTTGLSIITTGTAAPDITVVWR